MNLTHMQSYSRPDAIRRMNELSGRHQPFLFIIDYKGERSFIEELDRIDSSLCLYDFNGRTNAPFPPDCYPGQVEWDFYPMLPEDYRKAFETVRHHLLAGNSYLTNLTCRVPVRTNLSLDDVFRHSKALYKLWLKDTFVCFSPEIFVRIADGEIKSFPMKGTIDAALPDAAQRLMDDPKEAAEHATIVDLIRNDLSMVAEQVHVSRYRYCDRLETNRGPIYQTSSEICGTLPADYPSYIGDILFRLLPAGSITGAPKPKTMAIIDEAEDYERGFYTGVMGYCDGRQLDSAVMIRFLEQEGDRLYYKAGGGITAKSDWKSEYDEMIQKIYVPIC